MINLLYNEKECEEFYNKAIRRLSVGESEESVFADKPRGFTKWLKKKPEGIKLPKPKSIPLYECWKCGKVYQSNKCPYCGSFKPRR